MSCAVPARPPADVLARRRCLHPTFWSSAVGRMSGAFQSGMIAGCLPRCPSGKTPWTTAFHWQRQVPAVSSPTFLAAADAQTVADVGLRPNNYLHYKLQWLGRRWLRGRSDSNPGSPEANSQAQSGCPSPANWKSPPTYSASRFRGVMEMIRW